MYLKASINIEEFAEAIESHKHLVKKSRAGNMFLPIVISVSRKKDMNGNNIKISINQGRNSPADQNVYIGAGYISDEILDGMGI